MKKIIISILFILSFATNVLAETYTPLAFDNIESINEVTFENGNSLEIQAGSFEVYSESPTPIFDFGFEDGNTDGIVVESGAFSVSDGEYVQPSDSAAVSRAMLSGEFSDYILEFDATAKNGAPTAIAFLGYTSDTFYTFEYSYSGAVLRDNAGNDILKADSNFKADETYHFKLKVENGIFKAYINSSEEPFMETTDCIIPKGGVGFGTWASPVSFDNIKLSSLAKEGHKDKLVSYDKNQGIATKETYEKNIRISSNIKVTSFATGEAGIILREGYYFVADGENVTIKKKTEKGFTSLACAPCRLMSNTFYLFSARAEGEKFTFSINNTDIISVFDDTYVSGYYGIYKNGTGVLVDNIFVDKINTEIVAEMHNDEHLSAYSVLSKIGAGEFTKENCGQTVTRLEFATILSNILKLNPSEKALFSDTDSPYANALIQMGYMFVKNGKFNPNDEISFEDAIYSALMHAGFKNDLAISKNAMSIGASKGLTDGIKNSNLTRADVAVILLRAMELEGYNDKTILESSFGIKKITGIADGFEINDAVPEGVYIINGYEIRTDIKDLSGRNVKCYYLDEKGENGGEAVYISRYKCTETNLDSEDIESVSDNLTITTTGGRKIKLKSDYVVVLNGKNVGKLSSNSKDILKPEFGKVTIISNENQAKGYIIIESYRLVLADRISNSNELITDLLTKKTVDLTNVDIIYPNKTKAKIEDIKKFDILKMYTDGKTKTAILEHSNSVSGRVRELREDTILLNSDIYKKYKTIGNIGSLSVGDEATVYFDSNYKAIFAVISSSNLYAYLTRANYDESGSEPTLMLSMYSLTDGIQKAYVSDKAKFCDYATNSSDKKISSLSALNTYLSNYNGLIKYGINEDGKIISIKLPKSNLGPYPSEPIVDPDGYADSLERGNDPSINDSFTLNFSHNSCNHVNNTLYSRYVITPETKILKVPTDRTTLDKFYKMSYGSLYNDEIYKLKVFDANEKLEAGVVVIYEEPQIFEGKISIITAKLNSVDENGNNLIGFKTLYYGKEKTIYAKEDLVSNERGLNFGTIDTKLSSLGIGDTICYHTDQEGYISAFISPFKDSMKSNGYYRTGIYGWGTEAIPHSSIAIGYARVKKVINDRFFINMAYGTVNCLPSASVNIYIYDKNAKNKVYTGTIDDIKVGDSVVCFWNYSTLNDVVVYR